MSMYAIDAIRMNPRSGQVERVRWGKVDLALKHWELEPEESDVSEVVRKIQAGAEVRSTFQVGGFTVIGPKLEVSPSGQGIEVVDPEQHPGRTINDMLTF